MDTAPISGDSGDSAADAPDAPDEPSPRPLTERDLELLAFERHWWRHAGAKEHAIKETFGFSATRYYQLLGELIDRPEALEHDPMLVKRLRRLRATRQRDRAARRLGMRP
ncbi:hypothetical protein FHU36_001896 [Nonomuraea muscovyensis]|uniref:DUF3263 domain-containing protein n=1 Tax=Nonomuraea muscovyensis TaxID=1124761 RepID=A0A7X0BYR4_9ACTN|nr:DUF3263 domain-containing protein [Nonomuraea muscovyensis]MBB6345387.1 hypothetical protein [Nonomuraea muscovyensis]